MFKSYSFLLQEKKKELRFIKRPSKNELNV